MTLTKMANRNDKLVPMKIILEVKIKQNRADCGCNVDTANVEDYSNLMKVNCQHKWEKDKWQKKIRCPRESDTSKNFHDIERPKDQGLKADPTYREYDNSPRHTKDARSVLQITWQEGNC